MYILSVWIYLLFNISIKENFYLISTIYNLLIIYLWAYGVVVSMFDFHRIDRSSNPGRGGKIS